MSKSSTEDRSRSRSPLKAFLVDEASGEASEDVEFHTALRTFFDATSSHEQKLLMVLLQRYSASVSELASSLGFTKEGARPYIGRLQDSGVLTLDQRSKVPRYRLVSDQRLLHALAREYPSTDPRERLRRRVRLKFDAERNSNIMAWRNTSAKKRWIPGAQRPEWFFDVRAVLHPALVTDASLMITDWSDALVQLCSPLIPDLEDRLRMGMSLASDGAGSTGASLFELLDPYLFPYDWESNEIERAPGKSHMPKRLLEKLYANGGVNKELLCLESTDREHGLVRRDFLEFSMVPHRSFFGLQAVAPIITPRVQVHRRLIAMQHLAKFQAHRLRQPAQSISLALNDLQEFVEPLLSDASESTSRDIRNALTSMWDSLAEFKGILKGLRTLGGAETKLTESMEVEVPVLLYLQRAIDAVRSAHGLREEQLATVVHIADVERYVICGHPSLLEECLFNVLQNAAVHGRSGELPMISVDARIDDTDGLKLVLVVEDRGHGMCSKSLRMYSELFSRLREAVPADVGRESGLTLAMMTIRRLGGKFELSRSDAGGLSVAIHIPVKEVKQWTNETQSS